MIIWLIFKALLVNIAQSTDYRRCNLNYMKSRIIKCDRARLGSIPTNIPANVEHLTIKNEEFTTDLTFPNLRRLKKLTISNSVIPNIPRRAFANLRRLEILIMYNIEVGDIHPEAFHGLARLDQLRLYEAGITELHDYFLKDSLNLKTIYLMNNLITEITRNTFHPLTGVNQLSLALNQISTIEEGAFECMNTNSRSVRLYLADNQLTTIPRELTESQAENIYLMMHGNPLICDCNLEIPGHLKDRRAVCAGPPSMKGSRLIDLKGTAMPCTVECAVPHIQNGYADHGVPLAPGEVLKIWCYPGYDLNVMPRIVCQADGTFGNVTIPECVKIREEPEELDDGSILLISDKFAHYPSFVEVFCPAGTVLKTCRCMEYYCMGVQIFDKSCRVFAAPLYPTKGYLTCLYEDIVERHYTYPLSEDVTHAAACRHGYQMSTCTNRVEEVSTGAASNFGELEKDGFGVCRVDCGEEECEMYVRCIIIIEKASCEPFSIYKATVTLNGEEMDAGTKFLQGDVVTVTCAEGYELDDDSGLVECVEGENYYPDFLPQCYEIVPECTWSAIDNVVARPGWTVAEGTSVTLSCARGYQGSQIILECGTGGMFDSDPQISCQQQELTRCQVGNLPYAELRLSDGSELEEFTIQEGVVLTVQCADGHVTDDGTSTVMVTCTASGNLNPDPPQCREIQEDTSDQGCSVPRLRNGRVVDHDEGSRVNAGTSITFSCLEGYELVNRQFTVLTCLSNQYFEPNELPRCRKKDVKCEVPVLLNGRYNGYNPHQFILKGERLVAVCYEGFERTGPEQLLCSDENFGGDVNTCERPDLDCVIPDIAEGQILIPEDEPRFKEGVTYTILCNKGYWSQYTEITCVEAPETYDPLVTPACELPKQGCVKTAFHFMEPLDNEPWLGETVTIRCIEGYTLYGSNTLTCSRNDHYFQYDGPLPQCIPDTHCEVPLIVHGWTDISDNHVENGTTITVACERDHEVYGDVQLTCMEGTFTGLVVPECRPYQEMEKDCYLPFVNNGWIFPLHGRINPGSTLELSCDSGYMIEQGSSKDIMCVTEDQFQPSILPQCVEYAVSECPAVHVDNGTTNPPGNIPIGQRVTIICNEGHKIVGPSVIECNINGEYEDRAFCQKPLQCEVPFIENAQISESEAIFPGESFFVVCDDGYEIDGDDRLLCLDTGEIRPPAEEVFCSERIPPCAMPNLVDDPNDRTKTGYIIENPNRAYFEAGESTYRICDGGYEPKNTLITCLGNDVWRPAIPECHWAGAACEFPVVQNGTVTPVLDRVLPWTDLTVTCDEGFQLSSTGKLMCLNEGLYNHDIPTCKVLTNVCNTPVILNGTINGPMPLRSDVRFSVECDQGFQLVGTKFMTCIGDDRFSDHMPTCQQIDSNAVECPTLNIQNAYTIGTPLAGYYVVVTCEEGYSILGDSKLRCLSDGSYDKASPQCVKKDLSGERICGQREITTPETEPDYGDGSYVTTEPPPALGPGARPHHRGKRSGPRVYGGSNAVPGEYPWNVLIEFTKGKFCGGSIINEEWVLTAGHCLLKNFYTTCDNRVDIGCKIIQATDVVAITAGIHNREDNSDKWQVRTATKLIIHPYFTSQRRYIDYDVGLIQVSEPFIYNNRINRVCLPSDGVNNLIANQYLFVSGWGKTNSTVTSDVLQKITVPYVNRDVCNMDISYRGDITETMFCAGYPDGKIDACQGDSGGPLVFLGSNGTFVQGGIVSWGKDCAREHFYGVYTNLAHFYDWIITHIESN